MKPTLFNTDMKSIRFPPPTADEEIRAILANRKTATRRAVKEPYYIDDAEASRVSGLAIHRGTRMTDGMPYPHQPYRPGDILYVRETWARSMSGSYLYRATDMPIICDRWRPSIHMPREAARIFLRVTAVRVERLQDITEDGAIKEGCTAHGGNLALDEFEAVWHSTLKLADRILYGWGANPWVWVIEFERISKEEAMRYGN